MACCGQNRSTEAFRYSSVTREETRDRGLTGLEESLRYTGGSTILVRGPVTGRSYAFTRDRPQHGVARSDVDGLVRTGLFIRASS